MKKPSLHRFTICELPIIERPFHLHTIVCNLVAIASNMLVYPPPSPCLCLLLHIYWLYFKLWSLCWLVHATIKMASSGVGGILVRCKTCLQVPDSRVRAWSQ